MRHLSARPALAAAIASVAVALLSASTPTFWQVSTRADFLKGDVENLSVDNDGRLSLGPPMALSTIRPPRSCGRWSKAPAARS